MTSGLDKPNGLALDVADGKMYWADAGTDRIQRANLDGSNVEDLVSSADGLVDPSGVAVGGAAPRGGSGPDLTIETVSVSRANPYAGTYFTLSAGIRNQGNRLSEELTVIYYRSPDQNISTGDTRVGTDSGWGIRSFSTVNASIDLVAPSDVGTYYYGACVVSVHGESDTANNCSKAVTVTVPSPPPFNIEIVYLGSFRRGFDVSQKALIQRAALRWMSIIAEDIPDVDFSNNPFEKRDEEFGMRIRVDDVVDDLRIFVGIREIDGKFKTLAMAKPLISGLTTRLPQIGLIAIDKDDLEWMSDTFLLDLILHEMAHVLGFGTLWKRMNLVRGVGDRHFTGPLTIQAFDDAGGRTYSGPKVPVENDSGHWRKSVFGNEIMTWGTVGGRSARYPLSAITIQSLADMGYRVNSDLADEYRLPSPASAKLAGDSAIDLGDCIAEGPVYVVDENGRVVGIVGE